MPVTVNINGLSAIHQTSNGTAIATVPDVCKTPSSAGPIPIPYPNMAMSSDLVMGTTTVTVDGSSAAIQGAKFFKSTGDEAGVAGGVASSVFAMEATFLSFSPTVTLDGKPACRLTDKMLMNKGNTVCMAGEMQAPVVDACPAEPGEAIECAAPDAPKSCVLRSVVLQCGHAARNLQIDLAKHDTQVLQVLSNANAPDKVIVEWDGNCGHQHSDCPSVGCLQDGTWKAIPRSTGLLELPAPNLNVAKDWLWVFKVLTRQDERTWDSRILRSRLCYGDDKPNHEGDQWIEIQIFPQLEWKAEFSIGYQHANFKDAKGKDDLSRYEEECTWKIAGSTEFRLGASSKKLAWEDGMKGDSMPLFGSLLSKVGWCAKVFESMAAFGGDVTIKPRWPKWLLSGSLKLAEVPSKPIVGTEGSFKFGFEPLFGIELQVSILDWLIRFAGGLAGPPGAVLAQALVQVRKRFAKGIGEPGTVAKAKLDIDIVLTAGGDIKGGFGFKFVDGKGDIDPKAALIDGGVDVQIEGKVIGTARIWRFEMAGAGKLALKGASDTEACRLGAKLSPKGGKDPLAMNGQIYFTGMAFHYLLYVDVGVRGGETDNKNKTGSQVPTIGGSGQDEQAASAGAGAQASNDEDAAPAAKPPAEWKENKSPTGTRVFEKKGSCVILQPWTWPAGA